MNLLNVIGTRYRALPVALCAMFLLTQLAGTVAGDDWPQFRGANRDGQSSETGLASQWPDQGPPLVWTAEGVGSGYSSVAVSGDRLFTIGDIGSHQQMIAVDTADGSILWQTKLTSGNNEDFKGSRSTPTVHDGKVFAMTTDAKLFCLDAGDGSEIWKRNLKADFGASIMLAKGQYEWQFSESPLVDDGKVIVTPGSRDASIVALDQNSGKEIWRCAIPNLGRKGMDRRRLFVGRGQQRLWP